MAVTPRFVCGVLRIARGEIRLNGLELALVCNVCGALSACLSESCGRMRPAAAACKACYTGANFLVSWSTGVPSEISSVYRFGLFEVDPRNGELRKSGVKLKLQDQPFKVLLKLLQRPGELVTREELRAGLWQEDTFVDFETGLNTAIKRLRETLGDSADNPRFIETLPRRGYRFIAPVEKPGVPDPGEPDAKKAQDAPQPSKRNLQISAILIGAAVVGVAWLVIWRSPPGLPRVVQTVAITHDGRTKNPLNPFVTDGIHLYFTEGLPMTSGSGIAQVSTAGGETTWMTTTIDHILAVSPVSPDRSELLVVKIAMVGSNGELQLWSQPLPAGAPHRVGNISNLIVANWAPDGHIIYPQGDSIMIANRDGSEPRQLAKVDGTVFAIRFSPDGKRVRFDVANGSGDFSSIWEMDRNGNGLRPLLPDWKGTFHCCGNWSPDGQYYYFQAGRGSAQGIWVLPGNPSIFRRQVKSPARLISGPMRFSSPVPSSDGKRLFVLGDEPRVELLRYDLEARRFDSYLPALSAGPLDFSIDRKWVAYVSYPDMTLWRAHVDGSDKMQLTFPPVRSYAPRWSPDGSQIVFGDVQFDHIWKIRLVSSSGGRPETLVQGDTGETDPTWTPEGTSIVYGVGPEGRHDGISRVNLKTREVSIIPNSDGLFSPRVSPDGRYISALNSDESKLMLFDKTTNHWLCLVEGDTIGYNEWSHDGKYIYFRENSEAAGELVRLRVKDRVKERLLSLKDFPQRGDTFTWWIGVGPDDAPLLLRDRSVQEIYALELAFH